MKKLTILLLALMPLLVSCNKKDAVPPTTLETPAGAKDAAKVTIAKPIAVAAKDERVVAIRQIDFFRSGRYMAEGQLLVKADAGDVILTGTWTIQDGKYVTSGDIDATITVTEDTITIGEETSDADVVPSNVQEGTTADLVCRSWKLNSLVLNFSKLGGKALYRSIKSLVDDIKVHELPLSSEAEQRLLNHEIDEITLDDNVIVVTFLNAQAFKGSLVLRDDANAFSYAFEGITSGDLFNATASGSLEFSGNNLIVSMMIDTNVGDLGSGSAVVTLEPAE